MAKILLAYLAAIVAWSTTPIGIKYTSALLNPSMSLYYRFCVTALMGLVIVKVARIHMPWDRHAFKAYCILGAGLGGGLLCAYWGFQTLPSGLGAVIFGLSPIVAALIERALIPNYKISATRYLASLVGLGGLAIIFIGRNPALFGQTFELGENAYGYAGLIKGSLLLLLSLSIFNTAGVYLRKHVAVHNIQLNPFAISIGGFMVFSVISGLVLLLLLPWMPSLQTGPATTADLMKEGLGILYMAVVGSILGFSSYNYIVMRLSVQTAAMVNFVTPIVALGLGAWLNHEIILKSDYLGTVCVLMSIVLYLFGDQMLVRLKRQTAQTIGHQSI